MIKILPEELKVFSKYIYDLTGITLGDTKAYLFETRLSNLIRELGCGTFSELYVKAKSDTSGKIAQKIIDAITTGETMFFRDPPVFQLLQNKILPELIDKKKSQNPRGPISIKIWSAGCSSGQEVYSIAIVLKELLGNFNGYNIRILGSDISDEAIARASRGIYTKLEVERGLPPDKLQKYFVLTPHGYKIIDEIRALATFKKINLMQDFTFIGKHDIVFCRYVAIYFQEKDKIVLFKRMTKVIEPHGALILGATESLAGIAPEFEAKRYLRAVFYQLRNGVKL
ncbi:MAG: protein-glutamate O-methyltransferase CheR [Syntrophobacterales bacterium]|nr:protein-glutamate O-methyltransferase CheR [Syntrophobacterales bacterium]